MYTANSATTLKTTVTLTMVSGISGLQSERKVVMVLRQCGSTDLRRYRTRVVSTAEQANLDWPDAAPQLVAGLSRSIGGIF